MVVKISPVIVMAGLVPPTRAEAVVAAWEKFASAGEGPAIPLRGAWTHLIGITGSRRFAAAR
jgi:hypothetical protein